MCNIFVFGGLDKTQDGSNAIKVHQIDGGNLKNVKSLSSVLSNEKWNENISKSFVQKEKSAYFINGYTILEAKNYALNFTYLQIRFGKK